MARIDDGQLPDVIRQLATPLAEQVGAELVDVEVKGQRGRRLVRLIADAEGGLDVDVIARLSRQVGAALDERDLVAGSYTLEVTSPGADRPLRRPRDFARNAGREVRIQRAEAVDGPRQVTGTVVTADDEVVVLDVDGEEQRLPLADIDHGKVVLPW